MAGTESSYSVQPYSSMVLMSVTIKSETVAEKSIMRQRRGRFSYRRFTLMDYIDTKRQTNDEPNDESPVAELNLMPQTIAELTKHGAPKQRNAYAGLIERES